jgi:hypothetical protein
MHVVGVLSIVVGLVLVFGLRFIGPPDTRATAAWTTHNKIKAAVTVVVAVVAGIFILAGGVN